MKQVSTDLAARTGEPHADTLRRFGGEFRTRSQEAAFRTAHLPETRGHARALMLAAAVLNTLFLASDWRFYGEPHFWVAIPARLATIALAIACHFLIRRTRDVIALDTLMAGWMTINALAVGALVTSGSDIALFIVVLLPMVYYLVVPAGFAWVLAGGAGTSVLMLLAFGVRDPATEPGLILAMVMLNYALVLVVTHANRLRRTAWCATREARATARALAASRADLDRFFSASPVPLVITRGDNGEVHRVNDAGASFLGNSRERIEGTSVSHVYVRAEERAHVRSLLERDGTLNDYETELRVADGTIRTVLMRASRIELDGAVAYITGIIDISDRKRIERSLQWLASTDPLTSLPNRLHFFDKARGAMADAARTGAPLALLMIDIDHFKAINDRFGHQAGDRALTGFAGLCRLMLRPGDIAARLGGEEFAVLLPDCSSAAALDVAERLRRAVETLGIDGVAEAVSLTVSIGVATVGTSDGAIDEALAQADRALYLAKRSGRNRVLGPGEHAPAHEPPLVVAARH